MDSLACNKLVSDKLSTNKEKYQTIRQRYYAVGIDGLILSPIALLIYSSWGWEISTHLQTFCSISCSMLIVIYPIICHGLTGQTPGKKVMSIKVVNYSNDGPLNWPQSMIRDLVPTLAYIWSSYLLVMLVYSSTPEAYFHYEAADHFLSRMIIIWWLLELITMCANKRCRAVHDFFADTAVIHWPNH